jgi:hypothetical protein
VGHPADGLGGVTPLQGVVVDERDRAAERAYGLGLPGEVLIDALGVERVGAHEDGHRHDPELSVGQDSRCFRGESECQAMIEHLFGYSGRRATSSTVMARTLENCRWVPVTSHRQQQASTPQGHLIWQ